MNTRTAPARLEPIDALRGRAIASPLASCALAALALLCTHTASAQQASPAPAEQRVTVQGQKNPSVWFKAESQHFVVYSDASQQGVAELLHNMERLDFLLRVYTKSYFKARPHEPKLTLYYHNKPGALGQHAGKAPADAIGLYNSCSAGVQAAGVQLDRIVRIENARLSTAPANDTLSFLFEGYARHFLYRHTDIRAPLSFIEGFAQYFADVRFSDNQLAVGKTPLNMGRYLNFVEDGHRYSLSYADVLDDNDSKGHNYAGEAGVRLEFAARSWLLTHFMLSSEENRGKLARYLNLANRDMSAAQAFETAYGIKTDQLGEMLWRYRLASIKVMQVEVPTLPTARIAFTGLPDAVTDYVMMDARLKTCPGRATGEALLRKMSANPGGMPNHPLARAALSRAQIDWGDPRDAIPYLDTLVRDDKGNAEALYLLGLAHLRAAGRQQGAAKAGALEAARRHLVDAVNADPASAEAAYALLRSELDSGEELTETAMTAAQLAWNNGREVKEYTRAAALVHAYAGNGAKSRQALSVLAHDRRDPAMAAWATQWQARLVAGVDRDELLAELRRAPAPDAAFKEWTIANDSVMQAVVSGAGVEQARHYLQGQAPSLDTPDKAMGNTPIGNTPFTR
ncbi:hypothetical protein [Pseudoduganella namucuonensis]|uniref:Tetratricopeptide repeat-containing protein n=1 Tax=Pseudoduganella namucuonensis TaxID=1035707 RepID=A0A1I7LBX4_9BURK|nr:hypothetical protein [Pseudoduganella namucuonensis]SFV07217.1 hypothetical protein SAMN05216552_102672 [Pseudoduganella namucuonensis]